MNYRVAVAVSGRGSNLLALAEALSETPVAQLAMVLADREVPALDRARERGIPAHVLGNHRDPHEWLDLLRASAIDLLVLAGYLKLVPAQVVAAMPGRIINVHPALLPGFGGPGMYGARVHQAVLDAGESESGATVHLVDEVYDRGNILGAIRVPVMPGDDAAALAARVLIAEHRLLPAAVIAAARAGKPVPLSDVP